MTTQFNLIDLIPQPLTFRDVEPCSACQGSGCEACANRGRIDGQRYDARTAAMFGPIDLATQQRLQREMGAAITTMQRQDASEDELSAASEALEGVLDDLMALIIPTMPHERITALESGYKLQFVSWWREQQPQPKANPQPARGRVTRGRPSRALSTPATTRSRS